MMGSKRYFENNIAGTTMQQGVLVPVPVEYVQVTISALEVKKTRELWKSDIDASNGYQGVCAMQWGLLMDLGAGINERLDRLYRLIDTAYNGTQYEVAGDEISPPIPPVPPASVSAGNAARAHWGRTWQLLENFIGGRTFAPGAGIEGSPGLPYESTLLARQLALQGLSGEWYDLFREPVTLADLAASQRVNSAGDRQFIQGRAQSLKDTLANGGSVIDWLTDTLAAGAGAATDGGLMAIQAAALSAQLGEFAVNTTALKRIVATLDGGGFGEGGTPEKNILKLLATGLFGVVGGETPEEQVTQGLVQYLVTRFGGAGVVSPLLILSQIRNYIGPLVNNLTANQQLDAIRQAGGGNSAPIDLTAVINKLEELKAELECICENTGGGGTVTPPGPTPPAFEPGACGSNFTAPDATSVSVNFSNGTTVQWVEWASAGPILSKQTITIGGVQRSVIVITTQNASACVQLRKYSDDPGTYSVQLDAILIDNTPASGQIGEISMDGAAPSQTTTLAAKDLDNETQVYKLTVNRIDGGNGFPETYTGPGPVVFVSIGSLG